MGIESAVCKFRRKAEKEGYFLNPIKKVVASDNAKTIAKIALTVMLVAAAAYAAGRRGYDIGYCDGLDDGFDLGEIFGPGRAEGYW